MPFTDDPIRDYDRYCRKQQKKLKELPVFRLRRTDTG